MELSVVVPTIRPRSEIEVIRHLDRCEFEDYEVIVREDVPVTRARNEGYKRATADKILFLDDDSMPRKGYLQAAADTLEDEPFVVGVSEAVVEAVAAEVPADQPLLRDVLDGLRAIGLGTHAGDEPSTTLALVYDAGEFASLETVRTVVDEVADGEDVGDDGAQAEVGLAQGGRVVVVTAAVGPAALLAGVEGLEL